MIHIFRRSEPVTMQVYYFIPDTHILQLFMWQCDDVPPEFPRVHKFLNFWHDEIDAIISEVVIG